MTPHETRDLFDELIDIARTVVCVADEGPDSARELGLCGGSPLVAACRAAVHRINAEAATVNPRAELSILRDQTAADVQTIATLQDENARLKAEAGRLQKFQNAVAAELCVENEHGPVSDEAIVSAAKDTLAQLFDSSAELATLKADADRREREAEALRKASISFLDRYVALVNSGDFGNWNPEDEPQVQALRKALTQRQEQSKP